ncbi:MAG TPA: M23 family metallopeptidase [Bryobacteraceae bacterium]|nr:M23 family metallopeptidase [Bryobacteraceae bacterium]
MRLSILLFVPAVFAQTITPQTPRQGDVLHISGPATAVTARMNGRTIRLFPQPDGGTLGLMPITATETPGPYKLEFLNQSGTSVQTIPVTVRDAHFASQNVVIDKNIAALKATPDEIEKVAAFRKTVSDTRYWAEPLALPVNGCMTSPYGVRRLLNSKATGDYHAGIDQRSPADRPIHAIAAGVVGLVGHFTLHGNMVAVDHGQGLLSMYLHMSRFAVTEGAQVKQGDVIGYVGSTGRSTAPHLHWSIYANGVPVNPAQWVKLTPCAAAPRAKRHK